MNRKAKNRVSVDKVMINKIVRKHLIMETLRNTGVQKYSRIKLNEDLSLPEGGETLDLTMRALEAVKSLTSSDDDVIGKIEFWNYVNNIAIGVGTLAALGGVGYLSVQPWTRWIPIKFKLMSAAAVLLAGGATLYYINEKGLAQVEKAKAIKTVNSGFDKFLKDNNPAKIFDKSIRTSLRNKDISLPFNESKKTVYKPSENLPEEIKTEEDAKLISAEVEKVKKAIQEENKPVEVNDFLGIPLNQIKEVGGSNSQDATAASIVDLIISLENSSKADETVKEIFRKLCAHAACEWDDIDRKVGEIFLSNMGTYDTTDSADASWTGSWFQSDDTMSKYSFGSDPEQGVYFGDAGISGVGEQIELSIEQLQAFTNKRSKSVIYECIRGYDFNFDQYNYVEIDKLAKAGISEVLGDDGLYMNFVAIKDRENLIEGNFEALYGQPALTKNDGKNTSFGPGFVEQINNLVEKKSNEESGKSITDKAKELIQGVLDSISNIDMPGLTDIKSTLIALVPTLIGGAGGVLIGGLTSGWVGALIGGLLGAITGFYAPNIYNYIVSEYFPDKKDDKEDDKKDDKEGRSGLKKSGTSNTTKENVKEIEGLINAYNDDNGLTAEDITVDTRWEGGGTGNTDRVWRDPFIKHVFSEHPVFKEKTFAGEVVSGQVWLWKDLSKLMISEYPDFTSDSAGCLAFVKFVYNEDTTAGGDTKGGGGASKFVDNSSGRLKGSRNSGYNDESDLMIGVKFDAKKVRSLESIEEDVRNKIIDVNYLGDMFPKLDEKISIALIRDMKNYDLFSGKAGTSVRDQGMQFKMKLKTKGSGDNIKISARPLEGRRHFRGMSKTFEEALNDRVSEVLRNSEAKRKEVVKMFDGCEVTIELKGGRYRVMGESFISEDDKRKLIRSAIINSIRRS